MKIRFSLSLTSEDLVDHVDSPFVPLASMTLKVVNDQDSCADDQFNEIVITPEQADYACIKLEIQKLIKTPTTPVYLKSKKERKFVSSGGRNEIYLEDTMSAKISVFHVMVTETKSDAAKAVVLNFTGTENFFCCIENGKETMLSIKKYKQEELHNSTSDPVKESLVFYMCQTLDGCYNFESALYRGWFLTANSNVNMQKCEVKTMENHFNLINGE